MATHGKFSGALRSITDKGVCSTEKPSAGAFSFWRRFEPEKGNEGMKFILKAGVAAGALGLLGINAARAELPLSAIIAQGRAVIDLRLRYENVDSAAQVLGAEAGTFRARLGYETGYWNGLQVSFDFDQVWTLGEDTYNSTRNGKVAYPTVLDPSMTVLNRLQLAYASDFDTRFVIGRQRLILGNQRFVGNVGWRQHEQTYDAFSAVNNSIEDLTVTYAWLHRVNRVGGPEIPAPSTTGPAATAQANYLKSDSHVINGVYVGIENLRLEGYALLLDFAPPGYATLPAQVTAVDRLDTNTFGARLDYTHMFSEEITGKLTGEFARQSDAANNPLSFDLNYGLVEGSLTYAGITGLVGYEILEGNGTIGFATPLATLHAFNGWADMFLATPANGLQDLYFRASYVLPMDFLEFRSLTGIVTWHDYTTDNLGMGIGSEWNLSAELAVDANLSFLGKFASYQGSGAAFGGFPDKTIFWLQAAYRY